MLGGADVGAALVAHPGVPLISATGSTRMGQQVAGVVAGRFGRSILELGGNNAAIVAPSADIELVVRGMTFAAAGTAGQRCTSLRRAIVHELARSTRSSSGCRLRTRPLPIGSPLDSGTLVGPLITSTAFDRMQAAIDTASRPTAARWRSVATRLLGRRRTRRGLRPPDDRDDARSRPTSSPPRRSRRCCTCSATTSSTRRSRCRTACPRVLASSIFTTDVREAERFCAADGSDCGIANVNIGPSGAEIGGAFGGEKATGGGRESGSDAWKAYMRRATNTINYSNDLPLAQGVKFG